MKRSSKLLSVPLILVCGCADGVIQRMPPPPSVERPDPIADKEADRLTTAKAWPVLVAAFASMAQLAPESDYGKREDAIEALLAALNPSLDAAEAQAALHPLARLDLALVLEEIARSRLRGSGTTAGSARQAERWDAAIRLDRFLAAAAVASKPALSPAVCDILLVADLRKFRLVLPCIQGKPAEEQLGRMPLDARVTAVILTRLAAASAQAI